MSGLFVIVPATLIAIGLMMGHALDRDLADYAAKLKDREENPK